MKRFLTLLGVFAIGEGTMLVLRPQKYLGFWAGAVSDLIAKMRPGLIERPKIARLLGLAELGFGMWCVTRRLGRKTEIMLPTAENPTA